MRAPRPVLPSAEMPRPLALGWTPSPTPLWKWPRGDLRPRRDEGACALVVDIDGVVVPARGIKRVAVWREDEANMGVRLLDHLGERGLGLVGAGHVVQEDVLRRVGRVERARGVVK